jgi:DNA-binding HxlR family transcriptional regulator
MRSPNEFNCPVDATIQLIGEKYKAVILWHLIEDKKRFSELKRLIPKATEKMLTQQLRDLEGDGLIIRKVYPVVPPKVEYSLSELGRSIVPVLDSMCSWGTDYLSMLAEKD